MDSEFAIATTRLTRDFGALRAVNDLSIAVPAGTIFGFLGPNGSGKSTTIRMLLGLLEPTSGTAQVFGNDIVSRSARIREQTGALLENFGLYERLTAIENLDLFGRIWKIPEKQRNVRTEQLLCAFDLWARRQDRVGSWSRGMKQKLAIARALLHRPRLVFLDEPTAGLDPVASAVLRKDLVRLVADEGMTFFLTTHNLSDAEKLCDRVAVIREGRLLAVGEPGQLLTNPDNRFEVHGKGITTQAVNSLRSHRDVIRVELLQDALAIELKPATEIAPLLTLLIGAGVQVENVRKSETTLDEAFLRLVQQDDSRGERN